MTTRHFPSSLLLFLFAAALLLPATAYPQSSDTGPPPARSTTDSSGPTADALARAVTRRAGDPTELRTLAFTFVVEVDGETKVSRRHVWWPREGRLEVTKGDTTIRLTDLHDHDLTKLAREPARHTETWRAIAADAKPKAAARAWSWFINDSYWLLAPAKLLDPGVHRQIDDEGRLLLTFDGVGLTPGDRYRLTIDRNRNVVTRWSFELQSGRTGAFRWTEYREFGPLYVSTRRISDGSDPKVVIRFENVVVGTD